MVGVHESSSLDPDVRRAINAELKRARLAETRLLAGIRYTAGLLAARPTGADGDMYSATDNDTVYVHNGTGWAIVSEPPQTWNVTSVTQNGAKACTTTQGWFQRANGSFKAQIRLTGFAAGTAGNAFIVPLPVTLVNANAVGGVFQYLDTGTSFYTGSVGPFTTTAVGFVQNGSNAALGVNVSFAIAAADVFDMTVEGRYA